MIDARVEKLDCWFVLATIFASGPLWTHFADSRGVETSEVLHKLWADGWMCG